MRSGVAGGALVLLAAACAPPPRPLPPPPPPPSGIYYEEELRPVENLGIEIIDLEETVSADGSRVTVSGTLINRGARASSRLQVRVRALDEQDRVVAEVAAVPSSERIPSGGGMVTFTATVENRPDVRRYHVEAIAR